MTKKVKNKFLDYLYFAAILYGFAFFIALNSHAQNTLDEDILTPEERLWVSENQNLKSTVNKNWAPMNFTVGAKASGFSIDYLSMVAAKVGINLEFISSDNQEQSLELIRSGEADIIHSISRTPKREEFLNFTTEYLILPMVYFGLSGSDQINDLQDFEGKKVGLIKGSSSTAIYIERYPNINFIILDSIDAGPLSLSNASIDVLIHAEPIINYAISKNFISGIEKIGSDFLLNATEIDYLHLATRNNDEVLLEILKKGMAAITVQEFSHLSDKWLIDDKKIYDIVLTREELDWLSQNKTIKVAAAITLNPIEFIDEDGKLNGMSRSYLDEISKRLDVEFVWSGNKSWGDGLDKINSGEADILTAVTPTKERESFLTFTDTYMNLEQVIYTRKGEHNFTTMDDLSGFTVVQSRGTEVLDFIRENYPDINIIEADNTHESLNILITGQADAYIADIPSVSNFISSMGYSNIIITGIASHTSNTAIGIRSDLPLLASAIKKALADISLQSKNEILNDWISVTTEIETDYTLVWYILIAAIIVLSLILLWLNKLRLEIKRRKEIEKALILSQKQARLAQDEAEKANEENTISLLELKASEARQKTILELAPQAVITFDADLNIIYFNENAQKTFGYKAKEVKGKHLKILLPENTRNIHEQLVNDFEVSKKTTLSMDQRSDIKALRKNGDIFAATASVAMIMLDGEKIYIVMLRDVTERVEASKLLIESEFRLSRAQKIAHIGNWEWNIKTGDLIWSDEIYNIFGLRPKEFKATYDEFLERIHPDDRKNVEFAVIDAVENNTPYSIVHRIICPDGAEKVVREIGEILRSDDGTPLRMDGTVQDITESWIKERELIIAKTKAEQANDAKTQFLAVMSHELRTPLNAIIGFSSLMKDETLGTIGNEKYRDYIEDINNSGQHLLSLIEDILDTSRIELDTIEPQFEYFAFDQIIKDSISLVDKKALEKQIKIESDIEANMDMVFLDPKLCRQIVINLLSNAAKFSHNNGLVKINLKSNKSNIELTVHDNGIGISEDDLSRIFEPFMQADSSHIRAHEGVGLGLNIVKKLVEIQNGAVSVTSGKKLGTSFKVIFPVKKAA